MKAGGRAGIVIKNTFLSNSDNASVGLRLRVADDLQPSHGARHAAGARSRARASRLSCCSSRRARRPVPSGSDKLDPGRNLGKTNALNDADLEDFVKLQANFADSDNSWNVSAHAIDRATWDLSVKNPNKAEETALREPVEIMDEILALDADSAEILASMRGLLQ